MMRKQSRSLLVLLVLLLTSHTSAQEYSLTSFPSKADPETIGKLLVRRFLEQGHSRYGSPLRVNEPRTQITYPDVCVWLGGLWFAQEINDKELLKRLQGRFLPLWDKERYLLPKPTHVDNNVFGGLVLELYKSNYDKRYKELGLMYADSQWAMPEGAALDMWAKNKSAQAITSAKIWADSGYSWQTRLWLDDMFMITAVQAQAYRVTNNLKYINRAAKEMVLYLDSLQLDNGLFYHAPVAPFAWGRANGWMACGFVELLRVLPDDNPDKPLILKRYRKMMAELKKYQDVDGMWKQVIDDPTMWAETSGTAMFTYSMIKGIQHGWLDKVEYGTVARKAWLALVDCIEDNGDVRSVCEGTRAGNNSEYYRARQALTGDFHGQAPALWCAYALVQQAK